MTLGRRRNEGGKREEEGEGRRKEGESPLPKNKNGCKTI
jgi:hypothetical protein